MPIFRKKAGKHHYRKDGALVVIKEGETIECKPEFLGGSISRFEEVKLESIENIVKIAPIITPPVEEVQQKVHKEDKVPDQIEEEDISNDVVEEKVKLKKKKKKKFRRVDE